MDMPAVNTYKDGVIAKLHKGLEGLVKSRNVTYVQGSGKLVSNNSVEVNGTKYTGKNVILATGSYPKTLPGLEIDGKQIITSEQAIKLDYVPKSVIVLGGGVIGCEFASVWKSFGAEVTIIEGNNGMNVSNNNFIQAENYCFEADSLFFVGQNNSQSVQ
jgi:dihydrolipoamide dehydrogenase